MSKVLIAEALSEQQQESEAIVNRLISTGKQINIDLPETLEAQKEWALNEYDRHLNTGLRLGYALNVIKPQMLHGEFTEWLKVANIKPRIAQVYMKTAKFIAALQGKSATVALLEKPTLDPDQEDEKEIDAILAKVIDLPLRKQIELTKETPERIRGYFEDGLFDEVNQMNPGQIRTVIRQQKQIESMLERNRRDGEAIVEKDQQIKQMIKMPKHAPRIQAMREQLMADIELINGALSRTRKSFEVAKDMTAEHEFYTKENVVYPMLHLLNLVKGHALLLSKNCWERWDIDGAIPVSMPAKEELSKQNLWFAAQTAANQDKLTESFLQLDKDQKKGNKP